MREVTWSYYKSEVVFTSNKLNIVYYQAKIYGDAYGLEFSVYLSNEIRINSSILTKRTPHEEG